MSFSLLSHLLLCTKTRRGSRLPHAKFSLQYLKFSLRYTMGNMSGMFSFAFWVIRALKCEAVNFPKFKSAGGPIRPFEYLDAPILIITCVPCMCAHYTHAQHDATRFACDANHVTMTSPEFAVHSCHIGMRWHDIIGVCVVGTPHHYGSHHMGMT